MIYLYAVIFGIVQGLTEFFPVSSSGHLLVLHNFLPVFDGGLALTFDVALHCSVLFILLLFYGRDLSRYFLSFFGKGESDDRRMGWMIILGTIPAALVGYFFEDIIVQYTRQLPLVAATLFLGGLLFFAAERWGKRAIPFSSMTFPRVFFIGCAQALALIPGMSRSGITIIAGLASGMKRDAATRFTFLLAAPIIALAGIKRIAGLFSMQSFTMEGVFVFLIGFFTATAVGIFCLRYLLQHVKTKTFIPFAVYRIVLGALLLAILFFR